MHCGFLVEDDCLCVVESLEVVVKGRVMPERKTIVFWVGHGREGYKLEVLFEYVVESIGCCLVVEANNVVLLKV